ncbi:hypothetical protein CH296_08410 [Rhodococcus sp. 14-2496-1d]|uniref:hypothetical protein n=1 Tax=Rhodococcus sp. 14-2496-1d TaxID=2023146 RepID=UPI000B9AC723|nr:hypothetical protein [Rhodococcus sp. 14-2496-1d]OZF34694.1 hypothetical protein CH296_08410 [Rhodococcus sp. 14-2496-1d]
MSVFGPLRLVHRETISPAQLGRTLCTEVAEQVPYWVAVLTPAERPLLTEQFTTFEQTSMTFALPDGPHRRRVLLLAALGSAVSTWQRNNRRGSSAGALVDLDLDRTGAVHPVRLPAVHTDALTVPSHAEHLLDDVARRLALVPNAGRDYALTRNYPALACRAGAQIIVRDSALAEPSRDHAIDIGITVTDTGIALARITWAHGLQGADELIRLWSDAVRQLATTTPAATGSSAA